MNTLFCDTSFGLSCFIGYPLYTLSLYFYLVVRCCRYSIVNPSTIVLMMAFVRPCSLYHTYPFWLVVNLTIIISVIILPITFKEVLLLRLLGAMLVMKIVVVVTVDSCCCYCRCCCRRCCCCCRRRRRCCCC